MKLQLPGVTKSYDMLLITYAHPVPLPEHANDS